MRSILLLAVLSCACAGGAARPPRLEGRIVELRESFTCPMTPSRGLITILPDGKVERVVFEGLDFKFGVTKSVQETMQLSLKDAADLFAFVEASGWQDLPENPAVVSRPDGSAPDACFGSLMVKTTQGQRSMHYAASQRASKVDALIKGVEAFLSRGTWDRKVLPWEKPAEPVKTP